MTDLSLYNIAEEQEAISALLEMDQGEITEDHEALIEQVEQMIAQKTDRVVGFFNYLTDEIGNAKKRKDEITSFIKVREAALCDLFFKGPAKGKKQMITFSLKTMASGLIFTISASADSSPSREKLG